MSKDLPENRTERKKRHTEQKIIAVAMDLFKTQGVDDTTMEQIAREVDIAKGTLYNYFPVKEAIINAYIQQQFAQNNADRIQKLRNMPDTRNRMTFLLSELIAGIERQKDIFEKYFVYQIRNMLALHRSAGMQSGMRLLAREIIELGQKSSEIRSDLPFEILVALFEFAFVEIAQELYSKPETFSAGETIEQLVDLFMNGARANGQV